MNPQTAYYSSLQTRIRAWGRELDRVRERAAQADESEQLAWYNQVEELEHLKREAEDRLVDLMAAGEDAPQATKIDAGSALERFGRAVAQLSTRER